MPEYMKIITVGTDNLPEWSIYSLILIALFAIGYEIFRWRKKRRTDTSWKNNLGF